VKPVPGWPPHRVADGIVLAVTAEEGLLKHLTLTLAALSAATLATASAFAQEMPPRWGLGLGTVISANPYAGRGTRVTPFPLITYDSERLFFRGITGGVHLYENDWLELDGIVQARLDGFDADDLGVPELAENGINRDLLEDRDDSLDAGFTAEIEGRYGEIELRVLADVTGASEGFEASFEYGYPIELTKNLTLTPQAGVSWMSKDMTQYYYGTLDEEVARGVRLYRPDAAAIPEIGIGLEYQFAKRWMVIGNVSYKSLPSEIGDSPLLESDHSASVLIGVLRAF